MQAAAIAAHRFGFSEASLGPLQADPRGWVLGQLRRPSPLDTAGLLSGAEAVRLSRRVVQAALTAGPASGFAVDAAAGNSRADTAASGRAGAAAAATYAGQDADAASAAMARAAFTGASKRTAVALDSGSVAAQSAASAGRAAPADNAAASPQRRELREAVGRALQRRWQHIVSTPTPVYERWVMFWSNHFCVAATKGATLGLVSPHEVEAIRPHATGSFAGLLRAATLHPAMLLYLDNAQSIGPDSPAGRRRARGLNENLARELLELHTLGVRGGYTQADIVEAAKLLTGWTVPRGPRDSDLGDGDARFVATLHEPGHKTLLGHEYPAGPQAVDALFTDLSRQPSTARFIAGKLARHFVADEPPPALVDAVAARFRATDGDLMAVADALFSHDDAWRPDTLPKFKRPDELVLSAHRVLQVPVTQTGRLAGALAAMGQPVGRAPSPAGWPDRSADWLAPDALWKRVEWAGAFAAEHAGAADARQLAARSMGDDLAAATRSQIERADSGSQALALWLASPEFQRR